MLRESLDAPSELVRATDDDGKRFVGSVSSDRFVIRRRGFPGQPGALRLHGRIAASGAGSIVSLHFDTPPAARIGVGFGIVMMIVFTAGGILAGLGQPVFLISEMFPVLVMFAAIVPVYRQQRVDRRLLAEFIERILRPMQTL